MIGERQGVRPCISAALGEILFNKRGVVPCTPFLLSLIAETIVLGHLPGRKPPCHRPQGMQPYLEMGVRHFSVGVDVTTLFEWYRETGTKVRMELNIEPPVEVGSLQKASDGR